jgi:hypothetical protein
MTTPTALLVLVVRIYGVSTPHAAEMLTAERVAGTILRDAGVQVRWKECRPERQAEDGCDRPLLDNEVALRLVEAEAPEHGAMGVSVIDPLTRRGSLATLYLPTIRSLSTASRFDFGVLLGRTAAHEIGHLLFGTSAHHSQGLMRPHWSPSLLQHDGGRLWTFSRGEAEELRRNLTIRVAHAVAGSSPAWHSSN